MRLALALVLVSLAGCRANAPAASPPRIELKRRSSEMYQLVPTAGQLPYCLAFSVGQRESLRQLTQPNDNLALSCPAGVPIGGFTFRALPAEGTARVIVVFSSERVKASTVAGQLAEFGARAHATDLRLPGAAVVAEVDFQPGVRP